MFFKRLSRASRSNSYGDEYTGNQENRGLARTSTEHTDYHDDYEVSPRPSLSQHNTYPHPAATKESQRPDSSRGDPKMYARAQAPTEPYSRPSIANGSSNRNSLQLESIPSNVKQESAPDLLTRAFNEALRPHADRIEQLESQLADLQSWCDTLERERADMHNWIDKRGLRPDVPASIASQMDSSPQAAVNLNAQLDRKITIVNFDLHRLQDDLNASISTSHFSSAMAKFLPDIARLTALPGGPRLAFDLILKLGGNLNSHGGLDSQESEDIKARREFYAQLDSAMVDVVRRRSDEEGSDSQSWNIGREIKRIEKTAQYLRNFGVEPYFPRTLEAMKRETDYRGTGTGTAPPHAASPPHYN